MMRRFGACLVLVSLLVAPPPMLLAIGFHDWGSLTPMAPTDVRLVLALLTVVGWAAWAVWLVAVVAEVAELITHGRLRVRLPGLTMPRALASALVGAVIATGAGPLAHAAAPAGSSAPTHSVASSHAAAATKKAAPLDHTTATGGAAPLRADAASMREGPAQREPAARLAATSGARAADRSHTHTVATGDDLWTLSARYYGSGDQWRKIVATNPGVLADPLADLVPGVELSIVDPVQLVTVRAGDSLSRIAQRHLGDPDRWPEIHRLNRARVADPDVIDVGWVLKVPLSAATLLSVSERPAEPAAASQPAAPQSAVPQSAAPQSAASTPDAGASASAPQAQPVSTPGAQPTAAGADAQAPAEPGPEASGTVGLASDPDVAPFGALVGGLTALTASAVLGGLAARRHLQERSRPPGRRFVQPGGELSRVETALGLTTDGAAHDPDREDLVERALRHLSRHWWAAGEPGVTLQHAVVGEHDLELVFADVPPSTPEGFQQVGERMAAPWSRLRALADTDHPVAYPALVTLGEDDTRQLVMIDLVASGVVGVRSEDGRLASEALSAMLVELACAPWASELRLLVVTGDDAFARVAGTERVVCTPDPEAGVAEVERLVAERGRFLPAVGGWDAVRVDPNLADAWAPHVVVFESPLTDRQLARVRDALERQRCGVAAVLPVDVSAGVATWELAEREGARGVLSTLGTTLTPQTVPAATRDAIAGLYGLADATDTQPAPWWAPAEAEDDVNIIALRPAAPQTPSGPRLLLLGTVALEGARGELPPRAIRQCVEYAAWLMEHPSSTAMQMCQSLLVADGTRRSNVSRLRTWLGQAPDGRLYLPDAYSGRIALDPEVSSDWGDLRILTGGGVSRLSLERLTAALGLVRGAPLADAAPGQWRWAEALRADIAALVRDVGVAAARLAREKGDLEASRWAANRALLASPDDEYLLGERIRTEHAAGRDDEVRRLVARVTRQARTDGVDLLPETVDLCQEVLEGRLRARA